MFIAKLVTKIRPGRAMRRAHDPEPTLRYRIASSEADLQAIVLEEPKLGPARNQPKSDVVYPLLLEVWDGGVAWGNQLDLAAALSDDWEAV